MLFAATQFPGFSIGASLRSQSLLNLSKDELGREFADFGEPSFRARQIWRAVYREANSSFDEMTNLPMRLRTILSEKFCINPLKTVLTLNSRDGSTDKMLFRLQDGQLIETVLMRYEADGHRNARSTVCISTQAGCALGCTFCATGQQGFVRNLSSGEIVAQVLHIIRSARLGGAHQRVNSERKPVTNVVFMGMGEPLANYDATMAAVRTLNDAEGVGIGARHITISTVGLVPQIIRLAREPLQINLAVSLHAADDDTRNETMPINRRYPIEALITACRRYVEETNRRVFFEYVLLRGQNDSLMHATRLGQLLRGLLCHVNVIPVNETEEGAYKRPSAYLTRAFQDVLRNEGVPSTVRMEKGIDINAGCGQLRARVLDDRWGAS